APAERARLCVRWLVSPVRLDLESLVVFTASSLRPCISEGRHPEQRPQGECGVKKFCAVALVACAVQLSAQRGEPRLVEWPYWGGDAANTRYSTLPDITPANVNRLERAWEWNTGEVPRAEYG